MPKPYIYWELTVLIPYLILVLMFCIIQAIRKGPPNFDGNAHELSVDLAILGFGISAAFFGSNETRNAVGPNALTVGVIILAAEFSVITISIIVESQARFAVLLTSLIFGVNTGLVIFVNKEGNIIAALGWGLAAAITGIVVFYIVQAAWRRKMVRAASQSKSS